MDSPFEDIEEADSVSDDMNRPLTESEEIRRRVLDSMSTSKRSSYETEELHRLNIRAERAARAQVLEELASWTVNRSTDTYNESSREQMAEERAMLNVVKLMGGSVQPQTAERAYMSLAAALVETGEIVRQAQDRYDHLQSFYESLANRYAALSPADAQWRVETGAKTVLEPLVKEVASAKRHYVRVQQCHDSVRTQKFLLDSLMSNWDRMNPYRQDNY